MRAVGKPNRGRAAADLLHGDTMLQVAEAGTAVLLLHRDAEHAELAQPRPELAGKLVAPVDLGGERGDHIAAEAAHAVAQLSRGLAEGEVERGKVIGDHRGSSLRREPKDAHG